MKHLNSQPYSYKKYHISIIISQIVIFILFITLWEISARTSLINPFIFSSPARIIKTAVNMSISGELLHHITVTLNEVFISFLLVMAAGIGIAVLLWLNKRLSDTIEPFLILLNSLPKSALAPMLIVWLGNNPKAIIVTAVSVAVFGTVLNIYTAFAETDSEKIKLILTLGGNRYHILTKLILPGSLKIIVSNMKVNIGLVLVGVVIGEFLAAKEGLGYLIIYGSQVFKMDWVAMSIVILCIISIVLFKITDFIQKLISKR